MLTARFKVVVSNSPGQCSMEQVVSRADLRSEDDDLSKASSPPTAGAKTAAHNVIETFAVRAPADDPIAAEEDEFDFRLFDNSVRAADQASHGPVQKITIRSPSPIRQEAGSITSARPLSHYVTTAPSSAERQKIDFSAMTGEQVLAQSQSLRPGSAYPWKVLHLSTANEAKSIRGTKSLFERLVDSDAPDKRKRPGKKHRIKVRVKLAKQQAAQTARKLNAETREAEEREKRTRRNREKKVKAKAREKAKKSAVDMVDSSNHADVVGDPD